MLSGYHFTHFLVTLGATGTIITAIESCIFELEQISEARTLESVFYYIAFVVVFVLMNSLSPNYIKIYGATMYNLSLLTTMVYGLLFGILLFNEAVSWLYLIGFVFIILGIIIYNKPRSQIPTEEQQLSHSSLFDIS